MMFSPFSPFSLLGAEIPGDPETIRAVASRCDRIAEQTGLIESRLRVTASTVDDSVWRGDAATGFRDRLLHVGPPLTRMSRAHRAASAALSRYADELAHAQDLARTANTIGERAEHERDRARAEHDHAETEQQRYQASARQVEARLAEARALASSSPDPAYQASLQQYVAQAQSALDHAEDRAGEAGARQRQAGAALSDAQTRLDHAQRQREQAQRQLDDAARIAESCLREVTEPARAWSPWGLGGAGLIGAGLLSAGILSAGRGAAGLGAGELAGTLGGSARAVSPPKGGSVTEISAWWSGLTPAERIRVIASHPDVIGNLDGIPAAARDRANRIRLDSSLASVNASIAATRKKIRDGRSTEWELLGLLHQRKALAEVKKTVSQGNRQLLLLDLDHRLPRAAVAVGNVDTADHVAVFTPGLETTVADDLVTCDRHMASLVKATEESLDNAERDDETAAAVVWIGYDVPQISTSLEALNPLDSDDESVASPDAARTAARDLARFYEGINASRVEDPHLVALGHSYGSLVTGYALQRASGVDDAVVFGSPGLGTDDIDDLNLAPGHLGVLEADRDAVADLGSFGGDPNQLPGVVNLSSDQVRVADGPDLWQSTGHSEYLDDGTTSQHNIAQTVAGLPRIEGDNHGLGDELRAYPGYNPVPAPLGRGPWERTGEHVWEVGEDTFGQAKDKLDDLGGDVRAGVGKAVDEAADRLRKVPQLLP